MFLEICLGFAVAGGLIVLLLLARWKISFGVLNKYGIRGPPPELYYGNTRQMARMGMIDFIDVNLKKYGPIFGYFVGLQPSIVVRDFETLKQILVKRFDCFIDRPVIAGNVTGVNPDDGRDIGKSNGNDWRRQRKILSKSFSAGKLKNMSSLIDQSCASLVSKLNELANSEKSFDVLDIYGRFSLEVILAVGFGHKTNLINAGQGDEFADAISYTFVYTRQSTRLKIIALLSNFPFLEKAISTYVQRLKVVKMVKFVEKRATEIIQNRLQDDSGNYQDLLQLLIDAKADSDDEQDNTEESQRSHSLYTNRLTEGEIVQNAILFINAGSDTVRNTLGFTTYLLALNPQEQEKVLTEIDEYFDANPVSSVMANVSNLASQNSLYDNKREVAWLNASLLEASQNIKYVDMVLQESLRMYPPAPIFSRDTVKTTVINGQTFPKGCTVVAPANAIHHSPDIWPDPTIFRPERFTREEKEKRNPMAHVPFGYGPRHCIAMRLALMEVKMALVAVLKEYRFVETPDTEKPLKMTFGFSMAPKNGIYFKIEKR